MIYVYKYSYCDTMILSSSLENRIRRNKTSLYYIGTFTLEMSFNINKYTSIDI